MNSNHLLESKRQFFYDNEGTEESRGDKIRLRGNKRTTTESLKTSSNISSHADMTQSDPFTDYPNVVQQTFSALQSLNTTLITNLVPEIIAQFETRQYFDSFTSMNGVELLSSLLSSVESTELKILFLRIIDGIAQMDEDDVLVTINAHLAPQLVHLCSILSPEILSLSLSILGQLHDSGQYLVSLGLVDHLQSILTYILNSIIPQTGHIITDPVGLPSECITFIRRFLGVLTNCTTGLNHHVINQTYTPQLVRLFILQNSRIDSSLLEFFDNLGSISGKNLQLLFDTLNTIEFQDEDVSAESSMPMLAFLLNRIGCYQTLFISSKHQHTILLSLELWQQVDFWSENGDREYISERFEDAHFNVLELLLTRYRLLKVMLKVLGRIISLSEENETILLQNGVSRTLGCLLHTLYNFVNPSHPQNSYLASETEVAGVLEGYRCNEPIPDYSALYTYLDSLNHNTQPSSMVLNSFIESSSWKRFEMKHTKEIKKRINRLLHELIFVCSNITAGVVSQCDQFLTDLYPHSENSANEFLHILTSLLPRVSTETQVEIVYTYLYVSYVPRGRDEILALQIIPTLIDLIRPNVSPIHNLQVLVCQTIFYNTSKIIDADVINDIAQQLRQVEAVYVLLGLRQSKNAEVREWADHVVDVLRSWETDSGISVGFREADDNPDGIVSFVDSDNRETDSSPALEDH